MTADAGARLQFQAPRARLAGLDLVGRIQGVGHGHVFSDQLVHRRRQQHARTGGLIPQARLVLFAAGGFETIALAVLAEGRFERLAKAHEGGQAVVGQVDQPGAAAERLAFLVVRVLLLREQVVFVAGHPVLPPAQQHDPFVDDLHLVLEIYAQSLVVALR
ncbi:hypothetical protein G6F31_018649 [Rhizopus arrhizus]|nr:hypothetical protein G6F31_018649 [Rhizopus arrhizus]